jgi:hypothetical protein
LGIEAVSNQIAKQILQRPALLARNSLQAHQGLRLKSKRNGGLHHAKLHRCVMLRYVSLSRQRTAEERSGAAGAGEEGGEEPTMGLPEIVVRPVFELYYHGSKRRIPAERPLGTPFPRRPTVTFVTVALLARETVGALTLISAAIALVGSKPTNARRAGDDERHHPRNGNQCAEAEVRLPAFAYISSRIGRFRDVNKV